MHKCAWCHREVREIRPIHVSRDAAREGGMEELLEDGYKIPTLPPMVDFMEACNDCVEQKYVKNLNAQQMKERHERRDRFKRAEKRLLG